MYSEVFKLKEENLKNKTLSMYELADMMLRTSQKESVVSSDYMEKQNLVWILYSWHIKLNRPIGAEEIKITTWASGFTKIKCFREFLIESGDEILLKCSCEFLILDYAKRKTVIVPDQIKDAYDINSVKLVSSTRLKREELSYFEEIQVKKEDMDENSHVNNKVYINWLEKILFKKYKTEISELKIIYSKEINSLKNISLGFSEDFGYFEISSDEIHAKGELKFIEVDN